MVAETFEQARDAAKHLRVEYREEMRCRSSPDAVDAEEQEDETVRQGDLVHAMIGGREAVDVTYTTKGHASAAMEPHAAIAQWDGRQLTVHASLQMLNYNISELADALDMEEDQVRITRVSSVAGSDRSWGDERRNGRRGDRRDAALNAPRCAW